MIKNLERFGSSILKTEFRLVQDGKSYWYTESVTDIDPSKQININIDDFMSIIEEKTSWGKQALKDRVLQYLRENQIMG